MTSYFSVYNDLSNLPSALAGSDAKQVGAEERKTEREREIRRISLGASFVDLLVNYQNTDAGVNM